jgi:nicotinamidase-related amidase
MRHEPREESGAPVHSIAASEKAQICEEVAPGTGDIVIDKQKFTAFYGTRLDGILSNLGISHLVALGVWTEVCFETSMWDALWRDYEITVIKDACGSSTNTVHKTAILDLANWLIGGRIMSASDFEAALNGRSYSEHRIREGNQWPYEVETIDSLYEAL